METLQQMAARYGIGLNDSQLGAFGQYTRLLLDWNGRLNLTAITDERGILVKHFLDSLLLLDAWDFPAGASVIDVGTGAGFPGVPLKVCRPDLALTLLDSLNKRVLFLKELTGALGVPCECVHGRAELLAKEPAHRERYDVATARAVAPLPLLCELCLGFVKVGGVFLAMKGPEPELPEAERAIGILGGAVHEVGEYDLPDAGRRNIIAIKKISQTPTIYPRTFKKMSNLPL